METFASQAASLGRALLFATEATSVAMAPTAVATVATVLAVGV